MQYEYKKGSVIYMSQACPKTVAQHFCYGLALGWVYLLIRACISQSIVEIV